jgi:hypothetical protein
MNKYEVRVGRKVIIVESVSWGGARFAAKALYPHNLVTVIKEVK